jgi:hypothetical protein
MENDTEKTSQQLADEAVEMFNDLVKKSEEGLGRPLQVEELEYIREKVMLHMFGFYEREEVVKENEADS